jgi:hypothetical protein
VSIRIYCVNPANLLAAIKKGIDEKHIETWSYDKDGDFTCASGSGRHCDFNAGV